MRAQQQAFDFDIFEMGGFNQSPRVEDWAARERARQEREDKAARDRAEQERLKAKREREAREKREEEQREQARRARRRGNPLDDPYQVLGVAYGASKQAIRAAWARLCKEHHPDAGGSEDAIKRINAAYSALKRAA